MSLKYAGFTDAVASELSRLESDFLATDRADRVALGLVLLSVWEKYPSAYEMFLEYCGIKKSAAEKMRKTSLYYDLLDDVERNLFRTLKMDMQQYVMSENTPTSLREKILFREIRNAAELKESIKGYRDTSHEESLADEITRLSQAEYDKFIEEAHWYYGKASLNIHKSAKPGKDVTVFPNRYADTLINVYGFASISRFFTNFKRKYRV